MWIFRHEILDHLDLRANGMAFSQEIKHEAFLKGFRCGEVSIEYRLRGGVAKLHAGRDGIMNTSQMFSHRIRGRRLPAGIILSEASPVTPNAPVLDGQVFSLT
jgi:hypothetical protein